MAFPCLAVLQTSAEIRQDDGKTVKRNSPARYAPLLMAALLALGLIVFILIQGDPARPVFDRHAYPRNEKFLSIDYPFLNSIPFSEGLTWVWAATSTNANNCWVLDISNGTILGELRNLDPLVLDGRSRRVIGRRLQRETTLQRLFHELLRRVGRPTPARLAEDEFWIVQLDDGPAERFRSTATWNTSYLPLVSPDFRRIVQTGSLGTQGNQLLALDVKERTISTNTIPGWIYGWWSNDEILYKSPNGFALFNMETAVAKPLVSAKELGRMMEVHNLPDKPEAVGAFTVWNGTSYQFYVADMHKKWSAEPGYLAQLRRDTPHLEMLSREFEFHWSDHFDSTGRYYIYSGRQSGDYSSAVFLRDLQKQTERLLVPEDKAYFSIPNFYGNSVVFIRSNLLWKIDLNGKNLVRLFPPEC
jgi:hypothetical protein